MVVGYLDGDGLVWATPGLPTDASATAATASTFACRPERAGEGPNRWRFPVNLRLRALMGLLQASSDLAPAGI